MTGGLTTNTSRLVLAMISLVAASGVGGAGPGGGKLSPNNASAHQLTRHGSTGAGRGPEEGEEKTGTGGSTHEEMTPTAVVAAVRAPVAQEASVGGHVVEGSRATLEFGLSQDHEVEGQGEAQQPQLSRQKDASRLIANVGRERRYGKRPRRRQTYASSPGLHSVDVGASTRQKIMGEALQHARWSGGRCWLDEMGRQRCQANVFLFGVSKCGESGERAWSRSSRVCHTLGAFPRKLL